MFTRRWKRLDERLADQARLLDVLERRSERAETILMIREPSSTAAADAYEGLRRQVLTSVSERLAHLSQLARLDAALAHGTDPATLQRMVDGWFSDAGLTRVHDGAGPDAGMLFDVVDPEGTGPRVVIEPAYVDGSSGRVVRRGRLRHGAAPAAPAADLPSPHESRTAGEEHR